MVNSVSLNDFLIGGDKLTVLAGPCAIESKDILFRTAEYLKKATSELDINYVFKSSYDKANRSSINSYRGLGMEKGLEFLAEVKKRYNVPVVTDVHETVEVEKAAAVADILQIPAFLCRQTDLLMAAGRTGKVINIKKGQFMAPEDMKGAVDKVRAAGNDKVMLCERGSSFGYHNLVVDMRSLVIMRNLGVPVVFDATHSVQLPGGLGNASGGQREFVRPLARAAAAIGMDALFCEIHPNPAKAFSDGPNSLDFKLAEELLAEVKAIHDMIKF